MSERLLKASELARICQVDPKTIHHWTDKGALAVIRTPGQHRRYKASEVRAFLVRTGFDVPAELQAPEAAPAAA